MPDANMLAFAPTDEIAALALLKVRVITPFGR